MGFHLRKSVRVGPLRFNLSSSGVGVSAGIRGLRVGTGPRGNYVYMGARGISYRVTLPPATSGHRPAAPAEPLIPAGTHDALTEIESTDVSQIVDSSSADLVAELNQKRAKPRLWPMVATVTAAALLVGYYLAWPVWALFAIAAVGVSLTTVAYQRDVMAKTVVLLYDFDDKMEATYSLLHEWALQMASAARVWHIEAEGRVRDRKYHAGASGLVRRKVTFVRKAAPPYVKTNIETVCLGVGRQILHFFPDRVLVYDRNGVGGVGYGQLELTVRQSRFIENGPVPHDAQVIDRTWRYVNKSGGPDRRFKSNPQLPVCLYDEVTLRSSSGLNEVIQVSRLGAAEGFAKAVAHLGSQLPPEQLRPTVYG